MWSILTAADSQQGDAEAEENALRKEELVDLVLLSQREQHQGRNGYESAQREQDLTWRNMSSWREVRKWRGYRGASDVEELADDGTGCIENKNLESTD